MLPLWNFFLERRQFSYVLIATLVLAGLFSLYAIPKENTPSIDIPYAVVTTILPGASAEDIETLVTDKIENQASGISHVDTMTSNSSSGVSTVIVQFDANADPVQSLQDLRDAVSRAEPNLPTDAQTPIVSKVSFNDQPILVASISGDLPPTEFSALGKEVSDDLKTINGVSEVTVAGVPAREVDVVVRESALEQYGIALTSVVSAIQSANTALPAGSISMDGVDYDINFKGGIDDPAQIPGIVVGTRGNSPVYLSDIATISDGLAPATTYSRLSLAGKPSDNAITLLVYRQSGASIQGVAAAADKELTALQSTTLKGMNVFVSPATDQSVQINQQLGSLSETGLETVALVIIALLLTIGWRESLVAALAIPLSFLIAFIGLYFTGNTLNFISLFALILAVGILVDSGIVVTEAIHARMRIYGGKMQAARAALHDYAWPLIAGTMATVAVFAPLFFLSGIVGKFIAGIPYTLIFVLIASIFVALGIVPLIAVLFTKLEPNSLERAQEEYTHRATEWYKRILRRLLENRRGQRIFLWTLTALFILSLILPFTGIVQTVFFPAADQDFVYLNIETPQGSTLDKTDLATREVEEILYTDPDISSFETTVGASSNLTGQGGSGANEANITVNLPKGHKKTSQTVVSELEQKFAVVHDARVDVLQADNGPSSGAPISIQFEGDDLGALITAADNGRHLLSSIPGATNIQSSTEGNGNEFELTINRGKAAALGVSPVQIASTLRTAIQGTKATSIALPDQDIDVIVKVNLNPAYTTPDTTNDTTIESIDNLSVVGTNGPVLLGSVLDSKLGESNAAINHKDKKRIETVSAYPSPDTTTNAVVAEFQKRVGELNLPAGITVSYGGETQDVNQSFSQMFFALIAGLVLMFMILIIAFNSIRHTLHLLVIVPLSLIGVLDGLALTGQPISFTSLLGVIALGGVIINHAIILMDSMLHRLRDNPGEARIDTVVEASATRLRPIALTTITTVIGMIPLAASDPTWGPLAFSIMFGLTFAIILTLVLVPVLFFRSPAEGPEMA